MGFCGNPVINRVCVLENAFSFFLRCYPALARANLRTASRFVEGKKNKLGLFGGKYFSALAALPFLGFVFCVLFFLCAFSFSFFSFLYFLVFLVCGGFVVVLW